MMRRRRSFIRLTAAYKRAVKVPGDLAQELARVTSVCAGDLGAGACG